MKNSKFNHVNKQPTREKQVFEATKFLKEIEDIHYVGLMHNHTETWNLIQQAGFKVKTGISFDDDKNIALQCQEAMNRFNGPLYKEAIYDRIERGLYNITGPLNYYDIDLCACITESVAEAVIDTIKRCSIYVPKTCVLFTVQGHPYGERHGSRAQKNFWKKNLRGALKAMSKILEKTGNFKCEIDPCIDTYTGLSGKRMVVGMLCVESKLTKHKSRSPRTSNKSNITFSSKRYGTVKRLQNNILNSGLTQCEISKKVGLSQPTISLFLKGKQTSPTTISVLSKHFK